MGNNVFPTLPGLKWNQTKTPLFKTIVQESPTGKEARVSLTVYPRYQYTLAYEFLRDRNASDELKQVVGFYLQRRGAYDSFLYYDPSDHNVANQAIGTGNGNGVAFQLVRTYGGFNENRRDIIANSNNTPLVVYLDGNVAAANTYSVDGNNNGILTFNSAPGNNVVIAASFYFYTRVRFVEFEDGDDAFSQFMRNFWELQTLTFITEKP